MRYSFLFTLVFLVGTLMYIPTMLKGRIPSLKSLENNIKMIGEINQMSASTFKRLKEKDVSTVSMMNECMSYMPGTAKQEQGRAFSTDEVEAALKSKDISRIMDAYMNLMKEKSEYLASINSMDNALPAKSVQRRPAEVKLPGIHSDSPSAVNVDIKAPVMDKLMKHFEKRENFTVHKLLGRLYMGYLQFAKLNMKFGIYYFLYALFLVLLSASLSKSYAYHIVPFFSGISFSLSRLLLFGVSAGSVAFWFMAGRNIWVDAGVNVYMGPLIILGGSALAMKIFDPNYPVWNRMLFSMILPTASAVFLACV